jgi:hypothetical protein
MAKDNGHPQLSSTAMVLVTVHDVNDNEPIFDQSFYNVSVAENEAKGRCILKVSSIKSFFLTNDANTADHERKRQKSKEFFCDIIKNQFSLSIVSF